MKKPTHEELHQRLADLEKKSAAQMRLLKRMELLGRLREKLMRPGGLNEKLRQITDGVVKIFEADFARIWLTKNGDLCDLDCPHAGVQNGPHVCRYRERCLHLLASSGRYTHTDGGHRRVPFGAYKIGKIAAGETSKFLTNDVTNDHAIHHREWAEKLGLVSFAGYRLLSKEGDPIGVLALFTKNTLSADDDAQIEDLAHTTALIIQTTTAHETLKENEEKYRRLFENLQDVYYCTDGEGKITTVSPSVESFTLYKPEELIGTDMRQHYVKPEERDVFLESILKQGRVENFETQLQRKDGTFVWVSTNAILKQDAEGRILGVEGITRDITRHKQAEKALQESEKRFRETIELLPSIVCEYDINGRITYVNTYGLKAFGYAHADIERGLYVPQLIPADETPKFQDRHGSLLKGGKADPIEYLLRCKDGSEIYVIAHSAPIYKNGEIVGLRSSLTPITERKQIEEALRQSEKKYRLLADNVTDVIWTRDMNLRLTYISPSVFNMLGFTVEEAMARTLDQIWSPDSLKRIHTVLQEELKIENSPHKDMYRSRTIEAEAKCKDGSTIWTEATMSFLRDKKGNPTGIIGVSRDITERKRTEEALRQSEEKYRTVLEANPDPVVVYDMQGNVVYFNPAFTRIFGWTLEERLGQKMDLFIPEKNWPETRKMIEKVKVGESFHGIETRRYTKAGKVIEVSISGAVYHDRSSRPIGSIINLRDISQQKQLEAQLHQAHKMEAIGTLAGGLAHDFNNLLMGIQGRASLMLMETDSYNPCYEHLKGIEDYVKNAADLTKQLLAFARGGKYEVQPTDLNELIKKSSEMFGRTKKEIVIHRKTQEGIWTVEVDRSQIEQVLLNLYVNAWQSMPGGGDLYLEAENVLLDDNFVKPFEIESGKYVKITVTDTGVGMDQATQERVFEPFFTTKEMGRGTGLGLASAYGIIKNHGGIIDVYSQRGEGATFIICLPASEKEIVDQKDIPKELLTGHETVLLVDDEEMIIDVGKAMFKKLGYKVLIAKSGREAVEFYTANKDEIDLVVLDLVMPDMGGGDTFDRLKKINPEIKVLLSSGYSIDGQAAEILKRGCDGFIQKPFKMWELSQKIRSVLDL